MTDSVANSEDVDDGEGADAGESGVDEAVARGRGDDGVDVFEDDDEASEVQADETGSVFETDLPERDPQDEFEALNDRHLRLVAEFNNFRRRSEQERLSAWSRARADLVASFLDVLDDLQRVAELDLSNATVEAIMEGIDLVERKFVRLVGDAGAVMHDPVGAPFDPEVMEAMMRVPAESDDQVDTVAQVFQKGYSLKGILVRPARVSVFTRG